MNKQRNLLYGQALFAILIIVAFGLIIINEKKTIEFEVDFNLTDSAGGFWIEWDLFKDGASHDTWFVGGRSLTITAVK